jgi:hypothetical protein
MDADALRRLVTAALDRIRSGLETRTPRTAEAVLAWMKTLWPGAELEDYWTHPEAYPMLLAPWWLEEKLSGKAIPALQPELIYSSINMYCYIRLIDNVMDGDVATDLNLLPVLGVFHVEFERVYRNLFGPEHPFWESFTNLWFHSAEVTMLDASMNQLDLTQFVETAGQKTCAAKIPVAAVAFRYGGADLAPRWFHFLDRFGCWSQMLNDTFDWLSDSFHHRGTFFLSEAARRKRQDESLLEWVLREGLEWGMDILETWLAELKMLATDLECPALLDYLGHRTEILAQRRSVLVQGMQNMAKVRSALDGR